MPIIGTSNEAAPVTTPSPSPAPASRPTRNGHSGAVDATTGLPTELASLLTPESELPVSRPRLAVSVEGLDKCGKTHWAILTTPDPVLVISNDPGTQAVVDKAKAAGRKIFQVSIPYHAPRKLTKRKDEVDPVEWQNWIESWNKYLNVTEALFTDKSIRTLVVDNESDNWHTAELAFFGKLAGNSSMEIRPKLNEAYKRSFWNLYQRRPDLNIVLIHRLKKKYIKSSRDPNAPADWSGEYETDGYNQIGFSVDVTLRMEWDMTRRDFVSYLDPKKCIRYHSDDNEHILGKRWYGKDAADPSAFWNLAMEIFPDTVDTPEVWGRK